MTGVPPTAELLRFTNRKTHNAKWYCEWHEWCRVTKMSTQKKLKEPKMHFQKIKIQRKLKELISKF